VLTAFFYIKYFSSIDQPRISGPVRVKKLANAVNAATKKNISRVKEENEDTMEEVNKIFLFLSYKS
jgi:hypothetical protein